MQAYNIGDAVSVEVFGEIVAIERSIFTTKLVYKVCFGDYGNAYLDASALQSAQKPSNIPGEPEYVAPDGSC